MILDYTALLRQAAGWKADNWPRIIIITYNKGMRLIKSPLQQGLYLEYATLFWNVVGFGLILSAAFRAHSVALAGFGLDSLIEIGASIVVLWELADTHKTRQAHALRLIGGAFFTLACYILVQSVRALLLGLRPETSLLGIVWLTATFLVMCFLAYGKKRVGTELNNPVLLTEARVTLVDACLAAAVLIGIVLNTVLGWWWADPVSSLVIVYYGIREGRHAWAAGKSILLDAKAA